LIDAQVISENFSLALGADTAQNSTLTQHEFARLSVTVDIPTEVNSGAERPVIVSLLYFRQQNPWQHPQVDGQLDTPTLLEPSKRNSKSTKSSSFASIGIEITFRSARID